MRKSGFTLIEIMISVLITAIIMLGWFTALSAVTIWKVRLIEKTNIEKEASYFSEKLFEMIKSGWTLDYEEYWNRRVIWTTSFSWGYYQTSSKYWNDGPPAFWGGLYYCASWNPASMWTWWCLTWFNVLSASWVTHSSRDLTWEDQRYGQYALQFIDFNINSDGDRGFSGDDLPGDENWDGNIIWDDDDEYLGEGPEVFQSGTWVTELYLISWDKKTRTYFRYKVIADPDLAGSNNCNDSWDGKIFTGSGCLWTIQFLRLHWKDWWLDHVPGTSVNDDGTQYDGIIDTWIIDPKFSGQPAVIAGSNSVDYWQDLFPKTMHVSDFEVYAYPNKDRDLAWKENQADVNIAPYIRLTLKLKPSWKKRKLIRWSIPELDISTTISLSELYSQ